MKIFVLVVVVIFTGSCRKNRTCECYTLTTTVQTVGNNSNTSSSNHTAIITKNKQKKKDFIKTQNCYGTTTTKTTNIGNTSEAVTTDKTCTVK